MRLSGNQRTILAVDDDHTILSMVRKILHPLGFRILSAATGQEAIRLASEWEDRIHLLVCDVVMPEMSGPELAVQLRERYPDMDVVFISGFMRPALEPSRFEGREPGFLRKPFTPSELTTKLREYF